MKLITGQLVTLIDCKYHLKLRFIIEEKSKGQNVCLARPSEPYHRLHVAQNGTKISFDAGPQNNGSFFNFVAIDAETRTDTSGALSVAGTHRLQSVALPTNAYIGVRPDGSLHARTIVFDESEQESYHRNSDDLSIDFLLSTSGGTVSSSVRQQGPLQGPLQPWELRRFVTEGFIIARQCVRPSVLQRCSRKLTHALSIPGAVVAGGTQGAGVGKLAGCYSNCSEVRDLFLGGKSSHQSGNTDSAAAASAAGGRSGCADTDDTIQWTVLEVVEALLGEGNVDCSATSLSAQIAFRFPELLPDFDDTGAPGNDGGGTGGGSGSDAGRGGGSSGGGSGDIAWHTDGLRQGKSHPFR